MGVIAFLSRMNPYALIFTMNERGEVIDDLRVYLERRRKTERNLGIYEVLGYIKKELNGSFFSFL